MKRIFLPVLLVPSLLVAQSQQPRPAQQPRPVPMPIPNPPNQVVDSSDKELPENYQLTLIVSDGPEKPLELSIVTASRRFEASLGEEGNLRFGGTLAPGDSDVMLVSYSLGWATEVTQGQGLLQTKSSGTTGSVRLKVGEEVPIFCAGNRTIRLSIKKLQGVVAK